MVRIFSAVLLILLLIYIPACNMGESVHVPPPAAISVDVEDDDPEMDAAEAKARETIGQFLAALANPKPEQTAFEIKVAFEQGDDGEYMWLNELTYANGQFTGTLNNDPQVVTNVRRGDRKTVKASDICDWLILENGQVVGGYTVRLLQQRQQAAAAK